MPNKLSIIIPAYNEEKTIADVIAKVSEQNYPGWDKEIIVVDDGSTDGTKDKISAFAKASADKENLRLISHGRNSGKGAAIKTGLDAATGDAVIVQDADLEYDPADIKLLLDELDQGAKIVYGSRNLKPVRRGYSHYVIGSKILDLLVNLFFGTKLTDVYTCYKLFKTDVLRKIGIQSTGFEMEMELTAKALKMGYHIKEVPIHYYPRKFNEGKKIRARDGLKGIWTLIKIKFLNQLF